MRSVHFPVWLSFNQKEAEEMLEYQHTGGLTGNELLRNFLATSDHTAKVMDNLVAFLHDPTDFNARHDVDVSCIPVSKRDRADLPLLAFIHDFYKILASPQHAPNGADFIADAFNQGLVRFHDVFGIINTGEASLLFLNELAQFIESLRGESQRQEFLNRLMILTAVDVASYGYLNNARLNAYTHFIALIRQAPSERELEQMALADTEDRLCRLIEANNRISAPREFISACLRDYASAEELRKLLLVARFDLGAFSFEPLARRLLGSGEQYLLADTTPITITDGCQGAIHRFFASVLEALEGKNPQVTVTPTCVGRRALKIYSMGKLSIKANANLPEFTAWSQRFGG